MAEERLAVIPARAGSKRVPGKNVRPLAGRPLLAYAVRAAVSSGLFARVVVSTDDEVIAGVAREHGADVPFLRDAALADDVTPVSAATADVLDRLDPTGAKYATVCQLMANCPFTTVADVLDSYAQFETIGTDAQVSVVRYGWQNPWWALRRDERMVLEPLFAERLVQRSQDLPVIFCPTGAVWWIRAEVLRRERTFHVAGRTGWEMPWQRGLDIDSEEDWALAEALLASAAAGVPPGEGGPSRGAT